MAKVKLQSKWKRFIAIVLAVLTSAAAIFGLVKLAQTLSSDTKEISPSFKRGALDVNGKYVDTNDSIVTEELFECQGLKITPDFDSTVSYQVFYYDQDQTYLECSEVQENAFSYTPVLAKYASVVITPDVDEDGEPVEVKWHQVRKYRKQITIEVNRKQEFNIVKAVKTLKNKAVLLGEGIYDNVGGTGFKNQATGFYFFDNVDVTNANTIVMKVKNETLTNSIKYPDGQVFKFPYLYSLEDSKATVIKTSYSIIDVVGDYTYISYNVSSYNTIFGFVDVNSVDCLELFVI